MVWPMRSSNFGNKNSVPVLLKSYFLLWTLFVFSLFVTSFAFGTEIEPKLESRYILYSDTSHTEQEWASAFEHVMEFWNEIQSSTQLRSSIASTDGSFTAGLKFYKNSLYLEVKNVQTNKTYFSYLTPCEKANSHSEKFSLVDMAGVDSYRLQSIMELTDKAGGAVDAFSNWEDTSLQVISEVELLYQILLQRWKELRKNNPHLSKEEFFRLFIEQNKVFYKHRPLGVAELTSIDGIPVVRVIHTPTELAFIISEENTLDFTTPHFKQYIARQHITAGTSRKDSQVGRDVILIQVPSFTETSTVEMRDPARLLELNRFPKYVSARWWREYWLSIKKVPSLSTAVFGLFSGVLQGATTAATAGVIFGVSWFGTQMGIDSLSHLSFPNAWATGLTAFAYGTWYGLIGSTVKNWERLNAPDWRRTLKSMCNSLSFYYLLSFVIAGGDMATFAEKFNPMSHEGLLRHIMIISAAYLGNTSKPNWYSLAEVRERVGISRGPFNIGKFKTGWSRPLVEYQLVYVFPFFFRLLERISNTSGQQITPVGTGILLFQIPFSAFVLAKYARYVYHKTGHNDAELMADAAERAYKSQIKFITNPKFAAESIVKFSQDILIRLRKLVSNSPNQKGSDISEDLTRFTIPRNPGYCKTIFVGPY